MSSQIADRCDFTAGDRIDQYTVKDSLGGGSFGTVFLVTERHSYAQYALKLLRLWEVPSDIREPLKQRFKMEYDTGQIDCDNLVRSLAYGTIKGNPYIVMEYCPGGDLTPHLGVNRERVPSICTDILIGLGALHSHGKVHRDLKPENVLFKKDGRAALTDFGIVGDQAHRMTQRNIFGRPNQIFGTYAYMPPEQAGRIRGGATVLPTTDIFSFGVLVFQLITGQLPFGPLEDHNDLANYMERSKNGSWSHAALHNIADGNQWEPLLAACLEADFHKRLQSVYDVLPLLPQTDDRNKRSLSRPQPQVYSPRSVTRGYLLRVLQGEEYGRTYDLNSLLPNGRGMLTIGRSVDNNIAVKSVYSDYMSRHHCTLEHTPYSQHWLLRDGQWDANRRLWTDSRNGTFVNSRPVGAMGYYLKVGDILTMGDVTIRLENY